MQTQNVRGFLDVYVSEEIQSNLFDHLIKIKPILIRDFPPKKKLIQFKMITSNGNQNMENLYTELRPIKCLHEN